MDIGRGDAQGNVKLGSCLVFWVFCKSSSQNARAGKCSVRSSQQKQVCMHQGTYFLPSELLCYFLALASGVFHNMEWRAKKVSCTHLFFENIEVVV